MIGCLTALVLVAAPGCGADECPDRGAFDRAMSVGWTALLEWRFADGELAYREAAHLEPRSESAWLGLQRCAMAQGHWDDALRAGRVVAAINPQSNLASARNAWVSSILSGEVDDPFATRYRMTAHGGFYSWRGSDTHRDLRTFGASVAVDWPSGWGLWGSVSASQSTFFVSGVDDYWQVVPVVGASWSRGGGYLRLSLGFVGASASGQSGVPLVTFGGGYRSVSTSEGEVIGSVPRGANFIAGSWGIDAGLTTTVWEEALRVDGSSAAGTTALQLDTSIDWSPTRWLSLGARGVTTLLVDEQGTEPLLAGQISAELRPFGGLSLTLMGELGHRVHPVDAGGTTVWSGDERFVGGYGVGLGWTFSQTLTLSMRFDHRFVSEQNGEQAEAELLGGLVMFDLAL